MDLKILDNEPSDDEDQNKGAQDSDDKTQAVTKEPLRKLNRRMSKVKKKMSKINLLKEVAERAEKKEKSNS